MKKIHDCSPTESHVSLLPAQYGNRWGIRFDSFKNVNTKSEQFAPVDFTVHGRKEVNDRVRSDIQHISRRIQDAISTVEALILVGGFGRGEGTVRVRDGTIAPLNDYDVVVVCERQSRLHDIVLRRRLDELSHRIANELDIRFVDLILRFEDEFVPLEPTKLHYDMQEGHYVIYGKDYLAEAPAIDPTDIPSEEIRDLLWNRTVCLLESVASDGELHSIESESFLYRQAAKAAIAVCDGYLLERGEYTPQYAHKSRRFGALEEVNEELRQTVSWAADVKLDPDAIPPASPTAFWRRVFDAYRAYYLPFVGRHNGRQFDSYVDYVEYKMRDVSVRDRVGVAVDLLSDVSVADRLRCVAGAVRFTPLGAYVALVPALFSFGATAPDETLLGVGESLLEIGVGAEGQSAWERLRAAAVENWYYVHH